MKAELISRKKSDPMEIQHENISFQKDDGTENQVINLYPHITYEQFEGFGGALTDAAGYVFSQMEKQQQEEMLDMYFSEEAMNYNRVRIHMDSCDFSTHMYSAVEDKKDETLSGFSFADTEKYIIPLLDAAQKKAGKKLKIMLSAWSPPAFMKTNESRIQGGSLKQKYRGRWAEYLCRYIEEFQKRGYEVERISLQNEPKAAQEWDSCIYSSQEEKEFLQDFLYPALQKHGLDQVEVFIWDHNKERLFERAQEVIDSRTNSMITGIAFHWYSGDHFEALDLVRQQYPDKKLILSESCLEFSKFDKSMEEKNAQRLAHDMIGNLNHGMTAFYDWNILLNKNGGPNHVDNFCDAPYLYHEDTGKLEKRKILNYYWHFSHFIKPGAVHIAATKYTEDLEVTAWKNPDGKIAVVFLNKSQEELPCVLRMNGEMASFTLESQSIASAIIES
jgi:glucosylceramidase